MIQVSVTIDQQHLPVIGDIAEGLRNRGMRIEQVLRSIGIISGYVPEERRSALEAVTGVASVDEQLHYRLPPPDADVQ